MQCPTVKPCKVFDGHLVFAHSLPNMQNPKQGFCQTRVLQKAATLPSLLLNLYQRGNSSTAQSTSNQQAGTKQKPTGGERRTVQLYEGFTVNRPLPSSSRRIWTLHCQAARKRGLVPLREAAFKSALLCSKSSASCASPWNAATWRVVKPLWLVASAAVQAFRTSSMAAGCCAAVAECRGSHLQAEGFGS